MHQTLADQQIGELSLSMRSTDEHLRGWFRFLKWIFLNLHLQNNMINIINHLEKSWTCNLLPVCPAGRGLIFQIHPWVWLASWDHQFPRDVPVRTEHPLQDTGVLRSLPRKPLWWLSHLDTYVNLRKYMQHQHFSIHFTSLLVLAF